MIYRYGNNLLNKNCRNDSWTFHNFQKTEKTNLIASFVITKNKYLKINICDTKFHIYILNTPILTI